MSLITDFNTLEPYRLPALTAADIRVTEWNRGDRFLIAAPEHKHAGRSGVLELSGGKAFLLIDGQYCAVRPEQLVPVALRVVR